MKSFLWIGAAIFLALPARAGIKIAYVDTTRAFESFYKTNDVAVRIAAKNEKFKLEIHDLQAEYQQASLEAQNLEAAAKDPVNSSQVRKDKDSALAQKVKDLELMDSEITRVRRDRGQEINDELSRDHQEIYDEIIKVISIYATAQGFDLVIDKRSYGHAPIMIFASGQIVDLTTPIITRLNATHHTH